MNVELKRWFDDFRRRWLTADGRLRCAQRAVS
jgi:hypothetical protein